jgi:hypothetical protein
MKIPAYTSSVVAIVLSVFLMATIPASAQQSSISFTNSATANGLNTYFNIALGKFNSNLGSLDAVTVTLNYAQLGGSFKLIATEPNLDQTVDGAAGRVIVRQSPTNSLGFTQQGETAFTVGTTPGTPYTVPALGQQTFAVTPLNAFTNIAQSINSSFWSAYTAPGGTGDVVFQVKNRPDITVEGGVFTLDATDFTVETSMTVTYTYTVPEPSTYALLALSAIGVAAYRWRRRA